MLCGGGTLSRESEGIAQCCCQLRPCQALFDLAPDEGGRGVELIDLLRRLIENHPPVIEEEEAYVLGKPRDLATHFVHLT